MPRTEKSCGNIGGRQEERDTFRRKGESGRRREERRDREKMKARQKEGNDKESGEEKTWEKVRREREVGRNQRRRRS